MCTVFLLPMSDHNRQRETNYKVNKRQEGINDEYFCRSSGSSQDNLSTSCQFHDPQSSQERRVFNGCDDLGKQGRNDFLERLRQYDISQCLSKVESLRMCRFPLPFRNRIQSATNDFPYDCTRIEKKSEGALDGQGTERNQKGTT